MRLLTEEVINNAQQIRAPHLANKNLRYRCYRMLAARLGFTQRRRFHPRCQAMIREAFPDPNGDYTDFIDA